VGSGEEDDDKPRKKNPQKKKSSEGAGREVELEQQIKELEQKLQKKMRLSRRKTKR